MYTLNSEAKQNTSFVIDTEINIYLFLFVDGQCEKFYWYDTAMYFKLAP